MGTVTLFEAARQRVGIRGASQALAYMLQWAMVRDDLGHEPTTDEYAAWWHVSERTAWREKSRWAAAFPSESTPARLLDLCATQYDSRKGPAMLGTATFVPA